MRWPHSCRWAVQKKKRGRTLWKQAADENGEVTGGCEWVREIVRERERGGGRKGEREGGRERERGREREGEGGGMRERGREEGRERERESCQKHKISQFLFSSYKDGLSSLKCEQLIPGNYGQKSQCKLISATIFSMPTYILLLLRYKKRSSQMAAAARCHGNKTKWPPNNTYITQVCIK